MTEQITWAVPGKVLSWDLGEGSTVEALETANAEIHAKLQESDADKVHMLMDMSQLSIAKSVFNSDTLRSRINFHKDPRWGCTVLYGSQNRALSVMIQMFSIVMGGEVVFAPTQAKAYAELSRRDATLPPWEAV